MRRPAVIALLVITAALLQTAVFPWLTLAGFRPDLLLLLTAAFALRDGPWTGMAVGFGSGLLHDLLLVQPPVGLYALVLLVLGYAIGVLRPYIAVGSASIPLALAFVSGIVATVGYAAFSRLLGDERYAIELVLPGGLLLALYNTLLAPLAFALVTRLTARFPAET